eukprot:5658148-Alexandrium_andersonii.AAC.1
MVALDHVVRSMAPPARGFWEAILKGAVVTALQEDNSACVAVATTGNNPTMRHLERTQTRSAKWLREQHDRGPYKFSTIE